MHRPPAPVLVGDRRTCSRVLAPLAVVLVFGCSSGLPDADREATTRVTSALGAAGGSRILSDANATLALNALGGARNGGPVRLFANCPASNPDCLWIYRQGMK